MYLLNHKINYFIFFHFLGHVNLFEETDSLPESNDINHFKSECIQNGLILNLSLKTFQCMFAVYLNQQNGFKGIKSSFSVLYK